VEEPLVPGCLSSVHATPKARLEVRLDASIRCDRATSEASGPRQRSVFAER
jgi:hypothetical protein